MQYRIAELAADMVDCWEGIRACKEAEVVHLPTPSAGFTKLAFFVSRCIHKGLSHTFLMH